MIRITLLACLLTVAIASPNYNITKEWLDFKTKFGKIYNSPLEEVKRLKNFAENIKDVFTHNEKYELGESPFWKVINIFADWSPLEFAQKYLMRNTTRAPRRGGEEHVISNSTLPESLDWRNEGYVTPVKDQASCGACYAFSAIGALEGQQYRNSGNLVVLSEQDLIDCSRPYNNTGCSGGLMDNSFEYVMGNGRGVATSDSYPYQAKDSGSCRNATTGATIRTYRTVAKTEQAVTDAVATQGPISCPLYVGTGGFPSNYGGGVFVNPNCRDDLNHAILIVGYGTDPSAGDYYIVKNSWGASWGENGYFRIARGNTCGLFEICSYPVV